VPRMRKMYPGREALERLATKGYRSGALTHFQAGQLLGLSRFEFDDFPIERGIYDSGMLDAWTSNTAWRISKSCVCKAWSANDPGRADTSPLRHLNRRGFPAAPSAVDGHGSWARVSSVRVAYAGAGVVGRSGDSG
jgi:hypothetical protein